MRHRRTLYGIIIILLGANLLFWSLAFASKAYAGRIPFGTTILGQSLSGLTREEAIARLQPRQSELEQKEVVFKLADTSSKVTLGELGYRLNIEKMVDEAIQRGESKLPFAMLSTLLYPNRSTTLPLAFDGNKEKNEAFLQKLTDEFTSEPKDTALEYQNGKVLVIPPENGLSFDTNSLQSLIEREIASIAIASAAELTVPTQSTLPAINSETQVSSAKAFLEKVLEKPLTIQVEEAKYDITPDKIFSFIVFANENNQLVVTFDETKIKAQVDEIAKKANIKPITKRVSSVDNVILDEGRDGRRINIAQATAQIIERLRSVTYETPVVLAAEKINRTTITEEPEYQLGRTEGRYIEIDLSLQRLNLIEGSNHVAGYAVSTGKWSTPTPIGEFTIKNHIRTAWSKRYQLYMPYWMAIQKPSGEYDGYGIHGLPYWPGGAVEGSSHIGRPASHGCVRLGSGAIEFAYEWATDGTKVFIHQ